MPHASIDQFPAELIVSIFEYLDPTAPSESRARHEPSLQITQSQYHPLKNVSTVSKRWRRIVLPLLFRHSRLRIDAPPRAEWSACPACGIRPQESLKSQTGQYHFDMMKAYEEDPRVDFISEINTGGRPDQFSTSRWALRFYHVLQDFLNFIHHSQLASYIQSFTLLSDKMFNDKLGRFPHLSTSIDRRYPAAAAFWQHLLSETSPLRIAIVAPPIELACLTNATIDTFGDW